MEYTVAAYRADSHGSIAKCKDAEIMLDTDLAGRTDAFNPAELLLAALAACMLKGIERVVPMMRFQYGGAEVRLHGIRQDVPPRMSRIEYEIAVQTDESDHRLELLHDNVRKYGTVFNTVATGTELTGTLRRAK
ncbi:MAG: OsmC family protein [Bryobacteraceae bacterium]